MRRGGELPGLATESNAFTLGLFLFFPRFG